jgi:hypothetical protein
VAPKPVAPVNPVGPVTPVKPVGPVAPKPVAPVNPVWPVIPADPVGPIALANSRAIITGPPLSPNKKLPPPNDPPIILQEYVYVPEEGVSINMILNGIFRFVVDPPSTCIL